MGFYFCNNHTLFLATKKFGQLILKVKSVFILTNIYNTKTKIE